MVCSTHAYSSSYVVEGCRKFGVAYALHGVQGPAPSGSAAGVPLHSTQLDEVLLLSLALALGVAVMGDSPVLIAPICYCLEHQI